MAIATGIAKQVAYKVESAWGTAPAASGAQYLRRVESTVDLAKESYASAELRTDYQVADFRHGVRRVGGNIRGDVSPKTYADFMQWALRRDFTAVSALTGLSITIGGTPGAYTLTRGSGDWIAGSIKIGQVVRLTAGSFTAGNLNNNLLITGLTTAIITCTTLNGSTLTTEGPIGTATLSITGKVTYTPTTGHTDKSFTLEHWYSDISQDELFTGCKVSSLDLALPPTGMATIDIGVIGKDITTGTTAYYTTPTALTTTGCLAAVNGKLLVGGAAVATCTGLSLRIDGGYSSDPVVGANTVPGIFPGRVNVSGQFTAFFENATMRDYFVNETEIALVAALTTGSANNADFISFVLPRIKVGGATKSDGERGLVATFPFQALFNSAGGAAANTEATTLYIHDSAVA
jgi:hypothetical protein